MSDFDETKMEGNVELDIKREIKLTTKALEKKLLKMNLRNRVLARLSLYENFFTKLEQLDNRSKTAHNGR